MVLVSRHHISSAGLVDVCAAPPTDELRRAAARGAPRRPASSGTQAAGVGPFAAGEREQARARSEARVRGREPATYSFSSSWGARVPGQLLHLPTLGLCSKSSSGRPQVRVAQKHRGGARACPGAPRAGRLGRGVPMAAPRAARGGAGIFLNARRRLTSVARSKRDWCAWSAVIARTDWTCQA
jgi:hypothetical protein